AAGIVAPGAAGQFLRENVASCLDGFLVVGAAKESEQEDIFGFEDGVALQLADPVAVGRLALEQGVDRLADRAVQRRGSRSVLPVTDKRGARIRCVESDSVHGIPFRYPQETSAATGQDATRG